MRSSSPAAGAKAIAVDDAAEPGDAGEESDALANRDQAPILSKLDAKDARPAEAMEPGPIRPSAPRGGSKLARVIALLERDHGATIAELIAATGWLAHTTRAALTGLRKRGYRTGEKPSGKRRRPERDLRIAVDGGHSDAAPRSRPSHSPRRQPGATGRR